MGWIKTTRYPKDRLRKCRVTMAIKAIQHTLTQRAPFLEDSQYNNCYETTGVYGPWQQGSQSTQYPTPKRCRCTHHPKHIQHSIQHQGKAKKLQERHLEIVPDLEDSSLPKELVLMFQPLYCKLCTTQLTSNVMAKLHYKSRNHEKKVRTFLIEYSERTGEPLHKRAKVVTSTTKSEEEQDPKWFHCDVCDLPLTGKMHAESHYMGKNHQRALTGDRKPAGKGFFNPEGKWVRQCSAKKVLADGEDTFGLDFRAKNPEEPKPVPVPKPIINNQLSKFHCNICNVGTTSQESLDMHYKGQKHMKKLKQMGLPPQYPPAGSNGRKRKDHKVDGFSSSKTLDINLSVYRTPSGDYYCSGCNLSSNSESQFKIHLKSKGHVKKSKR
ncbi:hypothetical protein NQ317_017809 [Molorchus minor]|uniref:Uncharacterized protein n=1 Tax=Molorchus minor TaxID=1323400 RepID=A0ABQ9K3K7_9CUCU|nr:hypothetical protein NQ317_017809 [Molorchus minor]